jgi:hypothetical protein
MEIRQLKNIVRKDMPIYYRMFYTAVAEIELLGKIIQAGVEFSIETKPTGLKEIIVTLIDQVDYPLVPLVIALKKTIIALDQDGKLPL